jgi:ethanolamine utilization protein EutJ
MSPSSYVAPDGPVFAGVDLGTANIVTAVVDSRGTPVAGVLTRSESSVRDGLILDYVGSISILRKQITQLQSAGYQIQLASAAYPPGTTGRDCQAFGNVVEASGLKVGRLIDEPSAASLVLDVRRGGVVDIGGGTTGISVIENGEVVYTADEPTGGIHVDLVLSGNFKIPIEEAETMKNDPGRHRGIFPYIRPVFQKMATIVRCHLREHPVDILYLVGGTSCFTGIEDVMESETGLKVLKPGNPLLVTPLGIALHCLRQAGTGE